MNQSAFAHLFKMPLPCPAHFAHYLDRLEGTPAYEGIQRQWRAWRAWEETLPDQDGGRAVVDWRQILIKSLEERGVKDSLQKERPASAIPKLDRKTAYPGQLLVSFDLVQANWTAIRSCDRRFQAQTWGAWTETMHLPAILQESKVLRQQVLGNVDPKSQQIRQAAIANQLAEKLRAAGAEIIAHTADEVVCLAASIPAALADDALAPTPPWLFRAEEFSLIPLRGGPGFFKEDHNYRRSLFGVPGGRFYLELVRALKSEAPDAADLAFMHEGHLAQWVVE